jgi:hypothetical protein
LPSDAAAFSGRLQHGALAAPTPARVALRPIVAKLFSGDRVSPELPVRGASVGHGGLLLPDYSPHIYFLFFVAEELGVFCHPSHSASPFTQGRYRFVVVKKVASFFPGGAKKPQPGDGSIHHDDTTYGKDER